MVGLCPHPKHSLIFQAGGKFLSRTRRQSQRRRRRRSGMARSYSWMAEQAPLRWPALPMQLHVRPLSHSPDIVVALSDHPGIEVELVGGHLQALNVVVVAVAVRYPTSRRYSGDEPGADGPLDHVLCTEDHGNDPPPASMDAKQV